MDVEKREIYIHCRECSKAIAVEYLEGMSRIFVNCPQCNGECDNCECCLKKYCFSPFNFTSQSDHFL